MPDQLIKTIPLPGGFVDAISHASSVDAVMSVGTKWVPSMLPTDRCAICVFGEKELLQRVHREDGIKEQPLDKRIFDADAPHFRVLEGGDPVFDDFDDLPEDASPVLLRLRDAGFKSGLIAPMRSVGRTIGTISLCSRETRFYGGSDAAKLLVIGKLLASQAQLMQTARDSVRQAETDALTGLANRARLMRVLDGPGRLHRPDNHGRIVGLLHIDLDFFKEVNDTLGHAAGDAVLKHAARAMMINAGPKDLVARLGGDEFIVVTRTDPAGRELATLARDIALAVSGPLQIDDLEARVGASIGSAMASTPDCTADRLIGNADLALYEVKRNGRGGIQAFQDCMRIEHDRRVRLVSDLQDAVSNRSFVPYFQPQVSLKTGLFSGFEMLARWPHPELGILDPHEFMALGVEAGLTKQIDEIVRQKGLAAFQALRDKGWDTPKMSFNASAKTLADPQLVDILLHETDAYDLTPQDLVIEVREKDIIEIGRDAAFEIICALSRAGFHVELDDFGAGLASMVTLARVRVSAVKLDGSLTALVSNKRAALIMQSTIKMARSLRLSVIAEGIETADQFSKLRRWGCDVAQGFGISKALPLEELITFMEGYGTAPIGLAVADDTARSA